MPCPLCQCEDTKDYFRDKFRLYQFCKNCQLVFVTSNYLISEEAEKERYDLHKNNPEDEGYQSFLMKLLTPMIPLLKPDSKGLDFGAGPTPALYNLFKKHGFQVERYDPFYLNNKAVLRQFFDFIAATEVVEHFYFPGKEFKRLFKMLNQGGVLGIMTMLRPDDVDFKNWWYKNDLTHVCFYAEETMRWISRQWNAKIEFMKGNVIIFQV